MQTKILIIAVIRRGDKILLRKKPDGSPPYKETWYIFGAELVPGEKLETSLQKHLRQQTGIEVRVSEQTSWDTEIKADIDGITKQFVYLDVLCDYVSGELVPGQGIEKLDWVPLDTLHTYDNVPPSRILFAKLGYPGFKDSEEDR